MTATGGMLDAAVPVVPLPAFTTARGECQAHRIVKSFNRAAYDRTGSFAGRAAISGDDTRFYDRKGAFNGHSTTSGNTTRYYDSHGAYAGKAGVSGGTTRYFDKSGKCVGQKTR